MNHLSVVAGGCGSLTSSPGRVLLTAFQPHAGLRVWARGFGRPPLDGIERKANTVAREGIEDGDILWTGEFADRGVGEETMPDRRSFLKAVAGASAGMFVTGGG